MASTPQAVIGFFWVLLGRESGWVSPAQLQWETSPAAADGCREWTAELEPTLRFCSSLTQ